MNPSDMQRTGFAQGELIDMSTAIDDGVDRVVRGLMVVSYSIPEGCVGAYYPEVNPLVPLSHHDGKSLTPAYKAIPVRLTRSVSQRRDRRA